MADRELLIRALSEFARTLAKGFAVSDDAVDPGWERQ